MEDKGPTCSEAVRMVWPDATQEEIETLLWGGTLFPFGSPGKIMADLVSMHARSGGNMTKAFQLIDGDWKECAHETIEADKDT